LGSAGLCATDDTDGREFGDAFCDSQESGHRSKGLAPKIHVEPSANDAHSAIGKLVCDFNNSLVKKLGFVNSNNSGVVVDEF
jgi:hypothetical protein